MVAFSRRHRQRVPAGRGGAHPRPRAGRGGDRLLRLAADVRARAGAGVRRATSASRCSRRRPTSWRARATAPTPATGARSASPSCSTCSARWPPSTATTRSRPAPTPTTRGPASGPGIRAAAERGAVTPLLDAGLTKDQVRAASRAWDLPTWDKPAAACLSSRIAYGVEITPHRLARVERAEAVVRRRAAGRPATCGCATSASAARVEVDRDLVGRVGRRRAGRGARGRASPRPRSTRWGSARAR